MLDTVELLQPEGVAFEPFLPSGFTTTGIYLDFDQRLYPIFGRVIKTGKRVELVAPGDVIVFRPQAYESVYLNNGQKFGLTQQTAKRRSCLLARIDNYDAFTLDNKESPLQLVPLGDRIIVAPDAREEISTGGVHIPDTATERPQEGTVLGVGPEVIGVGVGDKVIYSKYMGTEIKIGETPVLVLNIDAILARYTE